MMTDNLKTLAEIVSLGARRFEEAGCFFGHGTVCAEDEALWLGLFVLGVGFEEIDKVLEKNLSEKEQAEILALYDARVATRKPAAYLIQEGYFCGLKFYVDERVLVPRSPIAEVIYDQFSPWIVPENVNNLLDLCTGSGCIAIACAKAFPNARVVASDLSTDALAVAEKNVALHQCEDQVTLIASDLFEKIPSQQFDVIVSNPPYVNPAREAELPAEYQHEPAMGLFTEEDGLALVLRMMREGAAYLSEQGIMIIEVGESDQALEKRLATVPLTWLSFESGGEGVFVITRDALAAINWEAIT